MYRMVRSREVLRGQAFQEVVLNLTFAGRWQASEMLLLEKVWGVSSYFCLLQICVLLFGFQEFFSSC